MPAFSVFVSSTSQDLYAHRAVARHVISDMRGWTPRMMENWDALPGQTISACLDMLSECQLMVLIIAFRQGWVPSAAEGGNGKDSITALELQYARDHKIPVLAMMASENWPARWVEKDPVARNWVDDFRKGLNQVAAIFEPENAGGDEAQRLPGFRAQLKNSLVNYRERELSRHTLVPRTASVEELERAVGALRSPRCIPFLGAELFGNGPLSARSLWHALGGAAGVTDEPSLATLAEYKERTSPSREDFLDHLAGILTQQTAESAEPPVHALLRRYRPPLIVSTTWDLRLESQLQAEGHKPVIVCHVVRSDEGEHDGKVLVAHGVDDRKPMLFAADAIQLTDEMKKGYIIYKPQGSPLLPRTVDGIDVDTAVLTEADHLALFGRLENQATGIPTAFSKYFRKLSFIFLGYGLDVWHYRLIGHVFRSIGKNANAESLAVRRPASSIESLSWVRLGVSVLPMDPNELAAEALKPEPATA